MMLNPYILLGLLVFWLASVSGAYYKGHAAAQDVARAQYATELEASIAKQQKDAQIDVAAALEAGKKEAKVRVKTVTLTNTVERVLHEKPAPVVCRISDDTFKLMLAAVQIANGIDAGEDAHKPVPKPGNPVSAAR